MPIIEAIFPIIILALIGYAAARIAIIRLGDIEALSRFVFYIALPVLLFDSLSHLTLPPQINWLFLLSYYLVVLFIYGMAMWLSKTFFSKTQKEQGIFGLGASYSNLVLVGLPIILAGLGDDAQLPLFIIISVHSAILFFLTTILAVGGNNESLSPKQILTQTGSRLVQNPIVIGIALGLAVNLLNIPIPSILDEALGILSLAGLPCALILLGATLSTCRVRGHFREASLIIGLKLVLQPILVWILVFPILNMDPLWGAVAVMAAGMPVGINAYIFAQHYHSGVAMMSTAVLLSTVFAFFSQSVWLLLLT